MEFYERKDSNNYGVYDEGAFSRELTKSFLWMFIGLALSAITAYFTATSFIQYLSKGMFICCVIVEFALVVVLGKFIAKMSHIAAIVTFLGYSIVSGVTLSSVFVLYNMGSIVTAFLLTAVFFGCMALYGFVTKKDLSRVGDLCYAGLTSIVVVSFISLFFRSSGFNLVLSYISVAVFLGLTAYDIQKIKEMYNNNQNLMHDNMSIYAALTIYLDFINIFLDILKIIGRKKLLDDDD